MGVAQRLHGKTALVTGAARGIGLSVASRFAREGGRVIFADRDVDKAEEGAVAFPNARSASVDISEESSVANLFAELQSLSWSPNVVVANAGVQLFGRDAKAGELDLKTWEDTIRVNLTGTFLTVKYAVNAMLEIGGGSIVLTGSPTGINGEGADFTAYSASKAGVHGLCRTVAAAYARDNIRVNSVVPAYTETALVSDIIENPESREAIIGRIPMGRAGTPRDIEGVMVFLASDESAFSTGSLFAVDGGMTTL